ncbi:pentatricopeptide repeat-containing protein At5g47360-like [Aristolochia californica]|uniref:pentatricopeptide repeat-containing protein At5g47360-like n=1 Tax=Aristolochia californica TaxID=171875 RepID=UPI0035E28683
MALPRIFSSLSGYKNRPFSYLFNRLIGSSAVQSYINLLQRSTPQVNLEQKLDKLDARVDSSCIETILRKSSVDRILALRFFVWAGQQPYHRHSTLMYSKISKFLDIPHLSDMLIELLKTYKEENLPVSVKTFKVILNICREAKLPDLALKILQKMGEFNCRPDTVIYNVVIRLFVNKKDMDTAVNLMEEMAVMGLYPDLITYVAMIKGLCSFERLEEARRLFDEMRVRGCFPNKVVYSALIDGACHAGNLDMAMELLGVMENADFASRPNAVTYTSLIQNFCENRRAIEAVKILDHMSSEGCAPNWVTVSTLIDGLIAEGHVHEAYQVADRIVRMQILGLEKCYSYLVVGFVRGKNIWEAEKVVKKLLENGVKPSGLAISSLIRELCLIKRSIDAFGWLVELVKDDRLLTIDSNLHSIVLAGLLEEGHFVEVEALINEMVVKGVLGRHPYLSDVVKQLTDAGKECLALKLLSTKT